MGNISKKDTISRNGTSYSFHYIGKNLHLTPIDEESDDMIFEGAKDDLIAEAADIVAREPFKYVGDALDYIHEHVHSKDMIESYIDENWETAIKYKD